MRRNVRIDICLRSNRNRARQRTLKSIVFCCFFVLYSVAAFAQPPFPKELLPTWSKEYVPEPEFGGQLLLVQSGMQHRQSVVLVHGLGKNGMRDWIEVIKGLESQYHVIAFDLPGFGASSAEAGRYSPTRYANVLNKVIDKYSHPRPIVVGHSLGGAVALRFASLYPQRLERLILVDAAGILERTAFLKHSTSLAAESGTQRPQVVQRALDSVDYLRNSLVEQTGFLPDPMNAVYQNGNAWEWLVSDSPNTNAAYALVAENFSEAVFNMPVATYILWGDNDRVAPLRTGKLLARRLPQAQLDVIEGAGHVPMASHLDSFMQHLKPVLSPRWQPLPPTLVMDDVELTADERVNDLRCDRGGNITYSGRYGQIVINACRKVILRDLQADKITLQHSDVVMENVTIHSSDVGLETFKGVIDATNLDIRAPIGIRANASRLDLAGVTIEATQVAMQVQRKSRAIFSVSRFSSPVYRGYVHGAYSLKLNLLDHYLAAGR